MLLDSLKSNKATGPDRVSPRVLAVSAKSIASPLTKLINHLITHNTWPTPWKRSNVSPIHKKESESLKENYRPVSVLTAISKIFERVQFDQMYPFVTNVLSDNLSGFLKGLVQLPY